MSQGSFLVSNFSFCFYELENVSLSQKYRKALFSQAKGLPTSPLSLLLSQQGADRPAVASSWEDLGLPGALHGALFFRDPPFWKVALVTQTTQQSSQILFFFQLYLRY